MTTINDEAEYDEFFDALDERHFESKIDCFNEVSLAILKSEKKP